MAGKTNRKHGHNVVRSLAEAQGDQPVKDVSRRVRAYRALRAA